MLFLQSTEKHIDIHYAGVLFKVVKIEQKSFGGAKSVKVKIKLSAVRSLPKFRQAFSKGREAPTGIAHTDFWNT